MRIAVKDPDVRKTSKITYEILAAGYIQIQLECMDFTVT